VVGDRRDATHVRHSYVVISTIIIVYCPTHIYRNGWLTNKLSLLIILNLVSEPSIVRTLLSLSPLRLTFSPPLLNGL